MVPGVDPAIQAPPFARSHCGLDGTDTECILRGRVAGVDGGTARVINECGAHEVRIPAGDVVHPGDIVEVALVEGRPDPTALNVLVRPRPRRSPVADPAQLAELRRVLGARAAAISCIREFFLDRGFLEVPTPSLAQSPGMEPHLMGFATDYCDHANRRHRRWLPTSPEFGLKRALCAGLERVFEVKTVFRNGGEAGPLHSPEFTMLEWYRAFVDYRAIMSDTEELVAAIARRLASWLRPFRGVSLGWSPPFPRISVREAFLHHADIDLEEGLEDEGKFRHACQRCLSRVPADEGFASLFHRVMIERVEPRLGISSPVILRDYPASMAALSVIRRDDPRFCERFELYAAGVELANAFTEVNDAREMAARIRGARRQQRAEGLSPAPVDWGLLRAMRMGMPPAAGIALGLDRLVMAMVGVDHVASVLPFCLHGADSLSQRLGAVRAGC